jgi:hypothetical protein
MMELLGPPSPRAQGAAEEEENRKYRREASDPSDRKRADCILASFPAKRDETDADTAGDEDCLSSKGLTAWSEQLGIEALQEISRDDVEVLVGPKGEHASVRCYNRWGKAPTEFGLGGRRLARPRCANETWRGGAAESEAAPGVRSAA